MLGEEYHLEGIEVLHHSEYMLRLIRDGRLQLRRGAQTFTYHDPCELGRGSRIYDQPREVIEAVGVLLAGLFCGWARSRRPTLGGIPEQTVWFMNNMGLNTFIAIVGISTGPSFVAGFQQVGWSLFLVGAGATTLPLVLGVLIGRYLFRFNDALTLGCVAGARTTTAALGAVEDTIGSNVPSLGYTITYAIGNTLLIIWGVVLVLLLALLISNRSSIRDFRRMDFCSSTSI